MTLLRLSCVGGGELFGARGGSPGYEPFHGLRIFGKESSGLLENAFANEVDLEAVSQKRFSRER